MNIIIAPKRKPTTIVSSYLILRKNDQVCLSLRKNTGYCDGMYGLISGHVEENESAEAAMIREADEEAGLIINPEQLTAVHVLHRRSNRLGIDIFFECSQWEGTLANKEPEKCANLAYYPLDELPMNTIDYIKDILEYVSKGIFYSEKGW